MDLVENLFVVAKNSPEAAKHSLELVVGSTSAEVAVIVADALHSYP
jgi:hypothetical protein